MLNKCDQITRKETSEDKMNYNFKIQNYNATLRPIKKLGCPGDKVRSRGPTAISFPSISVLLLEHLLRLTPLHLILPYFVFTIKTFSILPKISLLVGEYSH